MVKWYHESFPSSNCGFDSRYPLAMDVADDMTPEVIMLGGASGTGKSAIARIIAREFDAGCRLATDVIRQVLRGAMRDNPTSVIHAESFNIPESDGSLAEQVNLSGFESQAQLVMAGVADALHHSAKEHWRSVVEGVHVIPGKHVGDFPVVEVLIVTMDEAAHQRNLALRDHSSGGGRPLQHYLDNFTRIRAVQQFLVEQARASNVPIVDTSAGSLEDAVLSVAQHVRDRWPTEGQHDTP